MSRIFSGIQPSGELHIGNYLGAVKNWAELQRSYESFFCIVDYHAITIPYEPEDLRARTREMMVSLLAAGLDPSKSTIFVQSMVPEHTELAWIFNSVTPLGELERQTQYKDKASRMESVPAGILNYPILQAADILLYRADLVPVGEDQVQHLELSREIARRWNARFGEGFFPEPQAKLTPARRIMGLDGNAKMSKSMGNTVGLLEPPECHLGKVAARCHRSGACATNRSRDARGLQHLPPASSVQPAGRRGERGDAMSHGRVGLHRVQEGPLRAHEQGAGADPRPLRGDTCATGDRGPGDRRRGRHRASRGERDDAGGQGAHGPRLKRASPTA